MEWLAECKNWPNSEIFWIIVGAVLISIPLIIYRKNCPEREWFWICIGLAGSFFIYSFLFHTKAGAADIAKIIVAYLSGVGLLFSYFYNKREERKINVHSEANWRDRLFNLAQKKNLTYQDILYFLTFFNNNAEQKDKCDYKLLQAIKSIIYSDGKASIIDSVYSILYRENENQIFIYDLILKSVQSIGNNYKDAKENTVGHIISSNVSMIVDNMKELKDVMHELEKQVNKQSEASEREREDIKNLINLFNNIYGDTSLSGPISFSSKKNYPTEGKPNKKLGTDCCYILKELSISDTKLSGEQRAAFQLCIEFLLKADWNKQMNKEAGIKKLKNKKKQNIRKAKWWTILF